MKLLNLRPSGSGSLSSGAVCCPRQTQLGHFASTSLTNVAFTVREATVFAADLGALSDSARTLLNEKRGYSMILCHGSTMSVGVIAFPNCISKPVAISKSHLSGARNKFSRPGKTHKQQDGGGNSSPIVPEPGRGSGESGVVDRCVSICRES